MQRIKKLVIVLLAVFFVGLAPLAAAEMTVSWEWLLDDPDVTAYRYQLGGEDPDNWTVVSADTNTYEVTGLDPYQSYTLYLQRTYDGVMWSASASSTAEAILVAPEAPTVTAEPAVVEEAPAVEEPAPVEAVVEEAPAVVEEVPVAAEEEPAVAVEETPVAEEPAEPAPVVIAPLAPIAPAAIAERPNELALSLLVKLGTTFPAMQQDGHFEFLFGYEPVPGVGVDMGNYLYGDFGLAFDVANLAKFGNNFGLGLRTDLLVNFMAGGPWDLPEVTDYFDVNNYGADLSLDLKLMLDMTFDPAVIYLGVGAGLGMPVSDKGSMYGNIITPENQNDWFSLGYFLSGVLGVRFYIGDMFSIGLEGAYKYIPSKADFTDGMHLFSGDIVLGFTF